MTRIEIVVVLGVIVLLCACAGFSPPLEFGFLILVGWGIFLANTVPKMTVEPAALAVGAAALVVLTILIDGLARWLYGGRPVGEGESPRRWRFRWSLSVVATIVLLFASGIALIGLVHETGWLMTAQEPLFSGGARTAARRAQSMNNLKQIGLAFHNYHQAHESLPPGGTFDAEGQAMHSWETHLLPYLEQPAKPDLSLPWRHPANAEFFQQPMYCFRNPGVNGETVVDGYGVSHYAANCRVMTGNSAVCFRDVTDGTSNTILAGEVNDDFKAWGDPVNWRDPALGINRSPAGFGGPWPGAGAVILLMDGSARFMREDTDIEVLKALATPAGGEKVPPF